MLWLFFLWSRRRNVCTSDVSRELERSNGCTEAARADAPRSDSNFSSFLSGTSSESYFLESVQPGARCGTARISPKKAPDPEPVVENSDDWEEPKGVRLDFLGGGEVHTVHVHHKPLGIIHNSSQPAVVDGFFCNSYASSLGVQQGWRLAQVNKEKLQDGLSIEALEEFLEQCLAKLPTQPLRLSFRPAAAAKDSSVYMFCTFTEQPLGFFLANRAPRISKVQAGSPAQTAGIQEGWVLASIGDYAVPHDCNSKELAKMLREAVALLPDSGKKFGSVPWRPWGSPSKF